MASWIHEYKTKKVEFVKQIPTARQLFPPTSSEKVVVIDLDGLYLCRAVEFECTEKMVKNMDSYLTRPYFDEFLRSICSLIGPYSLVVCMDTSRDDLVNMVFAMTYGKRKLKFLENSVTAVLASECYMEVNGERKLDKEAVSREINQIKGTSVNAVYVQDLAYYRPFTFDELVPRDHLTEMLTLIRELRLKL